MAVNISRTAREADSGSVAPSGAAPRTGALVIASATRHPPHFRQRRGDYALGDIFDDIHFADLFRKDKVHYAVLRLFVRLDQLHRFAGLHGHAGKFSPCATCFTNTIVDSLVAVPELR